MELQINGLTTQVSLAEQPDEWLVDAAQEIADIAKERGLALPLAIAAVAVEGVAMTADVDTDEPVTDMFGNTIIGIKTMQELVLMPTAPSNGTDDTRDLMPLIDEILGKHKHGTDE